ncbi:ABC transporter substrate-binding protein, partial [Rhizobium sp. BGM003]|nr:ABC transporter substrate-binding protein [Rhizobium phaseoli]
MTTATTSTTAAKGLSRRTQLKTGAAAVGAIAGSGALTGIPTIWAKTNITLRQFGTGVSNIKAIAEKCKADL